jgi:hypothetical protein
VSARWCWSPWRWRLPAGTEAGAACSGWNSWSLTIIPGFTSAGDPGSAAEGGVAAVLCAFLRNALDYVSRRVDDGCLQELR